MSVSEYSKLPTSLECPVDNKLLALANRTLPFFRSTKHTPNLITSYALICTIFSLVSLHKNRPMLFGVYFILGYFLDCVDGLYARKYNLSSKFGDVFEHSRDIIGGLTTFYAVYSKYRPIPVWYLCVVSSLLVLSGVHIGCQQRFQQSLSTSQSRERELIDLFTVLCPTNKPKKWLKWTRWFGTGTFTLGFVASTLYLHFYR